jgi:hypothetical protein
MEAEDYRRTREDISAAFLKCSAHEVLLHGGVVKEGQEVLTDKCSVNKSSVRGPNTMRYFFCCKRLRR